MAPAVSKPLPKTYAERLTALRHRHGLSDRIDLPGHQVLRGDQPNPPPRPPTGPAEGEDSDSDSDFDIEDDEEVGHGAGMDARMNEADLAEVHQHIETLKNQPRLQHLFQQMTEQYQRANNYVVGAAPEHAESIGINDTDLLGSLDPVESFVEDIRVAIETRAEQLFDNGDQATKKLYELKPFKHKVYGRYWTSFALFEPAVSWLWLFLRLIVRRVPYSLCECSRAFARDLHSWGCVRIRA